MKDKTKEKIQQKIDKAGDWFIDHGDAIANGFAIFGVACIAYNLGEIVALIKTAKGYTKSMDIISAEQGKEVALVIDDMLAEALEKVPNKELRLFSK